MYIYVYVYNDTENVHAYGYIRVVYREITGARKLRLPEDKYRNNNYRLRNEFVRENRNKPLV